MKYHAIVKMNVTTVVEKRIELNLKPNLDLDTVVTMFENAAADGKGEIVSSQQVGGNGIMGMKLGNMRIVVEQHGRVKFSAVVDDYDPNEGTSETTQEQVARLIAQGEMEGGYYDLYVYDNLRIAESDLKREIPFMHTVGIA